MHFFVISHQGTLVFLGTNGELRHARLSAAPANLALRLDGASALHFSVSNAKEFFPHMPSAHAAEQLGLMGSQILVTRSGERKCTIQFNGNFLESTPDGFLKPRTEYFEKHQEFYLLTGDELTRLTYFMANSWIRSGAKIPIEGSQLIIFDDFKIKLGDMSAELSDLISALMSNEYTNVPIFSFCVRFDLWKIRKFYLYNPLIYLAAFGKDDIFECTKLAVESAFMFGEFSGTVIIITDRQHSDLKSRFEPSIQSRIHIVIMEAGDVLDYMTARFFISEVMFAWNFQPVMYIDTDVFVDAPISAFLIEMCSSRLMHLLSVGPNTLLEHTNYYGVRLFEQDPLDETKDDFGVNTGIIAFANVGQFNETFKRLRASIYNYATVAQKRIFYPAADQAMANYVLRREKVVDGLALVPWAALANHTRPVDAPLRKGFIHFIGGVGNATPKLNQMKRYLEMMQNLVL